MPAIPKILASRFFPGMGEQYEVGLANVGVHVVTDTLAVNTARTDAQVIASAPNTGAGKAFGPIVHSLGVAPSAVIPMEMDTQDNTVLSVNYQFITADNSAVYLRAQTWTGASLVGAATRIIVIR